MASIWDLNVDDHHNANGDDDNLMEVLQKKVELIHDLSLSWGVGGVSHLPLNFFRPQNR